MAGTSNSSSNTSKQILPDGALVNPVNKLDADHYMAEDLDGVTESVFGSGNMSYASLQASQTDSALTALNDLGALDDAELLPSNNANSPQAFTTVAGDTLTEELQSTPTLSSPNSNEGTSQTARSDVSSNTVSDLASATSASNLRADTGSISTSSANAAPSTAGIPGENGDEGESGTNGDGGNDGLPGAGGGETIIETVETILETITNAIKNNPVIEQLQTTLNTVNQAITNITEIGGDTITSLQQFITEIAQGGDVTQWLESATTIVNQFTQNISSEATTLITEITNITNNLEQITDITDGITVDLASHVNGILQNTVGLNGGELSQDAIVAETLVSPIESVIEQVATLVDAPVISNIADQLQGVVTELATQAETLNETIEAITEIVPAVLDIEPLQDATEALADTLQGTTETIADAAEQVIDAVDTAAETVSAATDLLSDITPALNDAIETVDAIAPDAIDLDPVQEAVQPVSDALTLGEPNEDAAPEDTDFAADIGVDALDTPVLEVVGDVIIDPVEDIVGDVDLGVDAAADLLNGDFFGDNANETDNAQGDSDVTLTTDNDLTDHDIADANLDVELDPVEAIVGDVDLDINAATDILGDAADGLIDNAAGGSDTPNLLSEVGELAQDIAEPVVDIVEDVAAAADPVVEAIESEVVEPVETLANDLLGEDTIDIALDVTPDETGESILGADVDADIDDETNLIDELTTDIDTEIESAVELIGANTTDALDAATSSIIDDWTETGSADSGGLFSDVTGDIGIGGDTLPDPSGTVAEGLGALDIDVPIESGAFGGLFG